LEWLEKDIGTMIAKEDPQAKTLKLLSDVQSQLGTVRSKKGGIKKNGVAKSFRAGYTPMGTTSNSFWRMKRLLASVDAGYKSDDDPDYEPGDDVEQVKRPREASDTGDTSFTSGVASSVGGKKLAKKDRMDSVISTATVGKRSDRVRAEAGGKKLPYWVRALSLPEKFDPELGKFVAMDKGYSEEMDPDYTLPETDVEIDESEEEAEEKEELELLVKEAFEELPVELKEGKHKTGRVVSPVKVTLTPSKEGVDDPAEEILTLDSDEEEIVKEKPPGMWVKELLLTEQPEEYDSEDDPEYVPPSVIYETDKEYDEYSDGGDNIPKEEVASLISEQETPLVPPSTYIPIWVPVNSPAEKIARAKEELKTLGEEAEQEGSKSETSGKDTDSNGKKCEEAISAVKSLPKLEGGTGLTPAMRKLKVDRASSEDGEAGDALPKPKRERKKSKTKSGEEGEKAEKANGTVPVKEGEKDEKVVGKPATNGEKVDEVEKSASVISSNVDAKGEAKTPKVEPSAVESTTKSPGKDAAGKSKTNEKGKKTPSKKSPSK